MVLLQLSAAMPVVPLVTGAAEAVDDAVCVEVVVADVVGDELILMVVGACVAESALEDLTRVS